MRGWNIKNNLELDRAKFEFGAISYFMSMTFGAMIASIFAHDKITSISLKVINNIFLFVIMIILPIQFIFFVIRLKRVRKIYNARQFGNKKNKQTIAFKIQKKKSKKMGLWEYIKATTPIRYYSYVEGLYVAFAVTFAIVALDFLAIYYKSLFPELSELQLAFYKMLFVLGFLAIIGTLFTTHLIKRYSNPK